MSPESAFIVTLIGVILFVGGALFSASQKAWGVTALCGGLACVWLPRLFDLADLI